MFVVVTNIINEKNNCEIRIQKTQAELKTLQELYQQKILYNDELDNSRNQILLELQEIEKQRASVTDKHKEQQQQMRELQRKWDRCEAEKKEANEWLSAHDIDIRKDLQMQCVNQLSDKSCVLTYKQLKAIESLLL